MPGVHMSTPPCYKLLYKLIRAQRGIKNSLQSHCARRVYGLWRAFRNSRCSLLQHATETKTPKWSFCDIFLLLRSKVQLRGCSRFSPYVNSCMTSALIARSHSLGAIESKTGPSPRAHINNAAAKPASISLVYFGARGGGEGSGAERRKRGELT